MYGYIMVYSGSTQQYEMGVSGNALNISKNMILNTCRTSGFECSGILQVSVASVDSVYPDMPEKTP